MSGHAHDERLALCDLFEEVGPVAPTLCAGWDTHHLAAHLVVRERRLDAGPGLVLGGAAARHTERVTERTRSQRPFGELVATIRSGPPFGMSRVPGLEDRVNLHEYFVHHEDVRRANGRSRRTGVPELEEAVWRLLRSGGRLLVRRVQGIGIELARPGGEVVTVRAGDRHVRITGEPGELLLYLFGRRAVAEVELSGDESAVAALQSASLGL